MEKKPETKAAPKKASAFMKPVRVTADLAAIVGNEPMPRTEIAKILWVYIKKHNLQSKTDRRVIEPDAKLAKVFGSNAPINMFEMTSKISKHIIAEKTPAMASKL